MSKKVSILIVVIILVVLIAVVCGVMLFKGKNNDSENVNNPNNSGDTNYTANGEEANVMTNEDGTKVNISKDINEVEYIEYGDFRLSNISLTNKDGMTSFSAEIYNNSATDYETGVELVISFYNSRGELMYEMPAMTSTLLANSSSNINAKTTMDCTGASRILFSVN